MLATKKPKLLNDKIQNPHVKVADAFMSNYDNLLRSHYERDIKGNI